MSNLYTCTVCQVSYRSYDELSVIITPHQMVPSSNSNLKRICRECSAIAGVEELDRVLKEYKKFKASTLLKRCHRCQQKEREVFISIIVSKFPATYQLCFECLDELVGKI